MFTPRLPVSVWLFAAGLMTTGTDVNARADDSVDILQALAREDEKFFDGTTMTLQVTGPAYRRDPAQGRSVESFRVSYGAGVWALEIELRHTDPPVYRPPGPPCYEPIDFDQDGNLILWYTAAPSLAFRSEQDNRLLRWRKMFRVSPSGRTLDEYTQLVLERRRASPFNLPTRFQFCWLGLGRGFAQGISEPRSVKTRDGGELELEATGEFGIPGLWRMVVDPRGGFLVRSATFYPSGSNEPNWRVECSGSVVNGPRTLARRGKVVFTTLPAEVVWEVELQDLVPQRDDAFIQGVRERISALEGSVDEIMDSRDGSTVRIFPQER